MRLFAVAFLFAALSCGTSVPPSASAPSAPSLASSPPPAAPSATAYGLGTPLGDAVDAYVSSFGQTWGEASAWSGYVAIARDGRIVFGKGYGQADREHGVAFDPDTVFRLGSLTKPFTALAILQLEEQGRLRIDDSIRKYLPEFPPLGDAITLRHCLTHSSGLPFVPDDPALVAETGGVHPVAAFFAGYKDKALRFPPGERFEYSNAGYSILAAIVERVSGRSYEAYMQEHVFGPAGMRHTTTVSDPAPAHLAVGYTLGPRDDVTVAPPIDYVTFGCGNVLSTAGDLVAWDRALAGTRLLGEAAKRRMFAPEKDVGGLIPTPSRYALGWFVQEDAGHEVLWHGGGVNGFETSFSRVPDAGVAVVALTNVFGQPDVMIDVAQAAQHAALTGHAPAPREEPAAARLDEAALASLAGDYRMDGATEAAARAKQGREPAEGWVGLTLAADSGRLVVRWAGEPGFEVFRGPDGALFTKHMGFHLRVEPGGDGHPVAVVVVRGNAGAMLKEKRYVRLDDALAPAPDRVRCPAGMVRLPGRAATEPGAAIAPFCMDATEVTVAAYAACVRSGACKPAAATPFWTDIEEADRARWGPGCNGARKDRAGHPVNCVDWSQATAYCRARGERLPTQAEWEWAARGEEQDRVYPWGFRPPDARLCWSGVEKREGTCPVASFPASDARGGVRDLGGNVLEWTSTRGGLGYLLMGGAWNVSDASAVRAASQQSGEPLFRGPNTGFRCAR